MLSFDTEKGTIHSEDKFELQCGSFNTRQMDTEKNK